MVPGRYDITVHQRATFERQITLGIDLSGHAVYAQIWDSLKRRKKIADFEITITNAATGEFLMALSWEDTTPLRKGAVWDLMVEYADNSRDYWLEGSVSIDPGLTAPEDAG